MGGNWSGCCVGDMALMVMVEVPEGVTTGGGAVVVRLAVLPQAAAYRTVQSRVAARAPHDAKRLARRALSNIKRSLAIARSRTKPSRRSTRICAGRTKCHGIEGGSTAVPAVDTVTGTQEQSK